MIGASLQWVVDGSPKFALTSTIGHVEPYLNCAAKHQGKNSEKEKPWVWVWPGFLVTASNQKSEKLTGQNCQMELQ